MSFPSSGAWTFKDASVGAWSAVLARCGGVGVTGPLWDAPVEDFSRLVDIDLRGESYGRDAALIQCQKEDCTLIKRGSVDSEAPLVTNCISAFRKLSALMTKEFTLTNLHGLHARPAAMFVKVSHACDADIRVEKDGEEVNGKSIMGLMMLAAGEGTTIRVTVEGPDAAAALAQLETLIISGFGENG